MLVGHRDVRVIIKKGSWSKSRLEGVYLGEGGRWGP